jgi:glycerophosphoryl diester phosphodiesterase
VGQNGEKIGGKFTMTSHFKMADALLTFVGIFCTFFALFYGTCYFVRFETFDQVRVNNFFAKNGKNNPVFVVGHRGSTLEAPENTLDAFRHAAESGADAVEFDVDFSKDGHAIIIHDATVDRTTNSTGRVCDYTLAEIRKLNALGDIFKNRFSEKYTFSQVPTLVETRETGLELGIKMFIEVKAYQHSVKVNITQF